MTGANSRSFPPDTFTAGVVLSRGIRPLFRLETLWKDRSQRPMYHGLYNTGPQNRLFTLLESPKATDHRFVFTKNWGLLWLAVELFSDRGALGKLEGHDHGVGQPPASPPRIQDTGSKFLEKLGV
jgi:hypothetical protein